VVRDEGRIGVTPQALRAWAAGLRADDQVALEATGNSDAIANLLMPLVGRWWCPTRPRRGRLLRRR
jgi:transposase